VAGLAATLGSGAMTNSMEEVLKAKVIFLTGSNPTWNHPVFGALLKRAVKFNGAKLIIADPRRIDLVKHADVWLQQKNGTDVALLSGIQAIILSEGWEAKEYLKERCEGYDAWREAMLRFTPERTEAITGVPKEKIYEAAKLYASLRPGALYYCMGITQHSHGVDNVKACVNLQLCTGNIGFEGAGVNPLRGQNSVQGACDMGGLPNVFTGYQPVTVPAAVEKFSKAWNAKLSDKVGMVLTEMVPACGDKIKALYVLGENPMVSDPNLHHVEESLKKLDLLVVQDIFLTETARMADVVLPGVCFAEKTGTFSNTERRVQLNRQAVQPVGNVRQDYEIIADLAARFDHQFPRTPEGLFEEIRQLTPSYAGLTYERLEDVGIAWPCPTVEHPGTRFLHKDKFSRGLALLTAMDYKPSAELPDADWDMTLSTGRLAEHYHTGSMTRRAAILDTIVKTGHVELHPEDAKAHDVVDGERVAVSTRRGRIETLVKVTDRVARGSIFVPFHFAEAAANQLTNDVLDPIAKIPEYKVCAARLEKLSPAEARR
jgi:predicted molibdopterin-dependent oxidoreductase YjgC